MKENKEKYVMLIVLLVGIAIGGVFMQIQGAAEVMHLREEAREANELINELSEENFEYVSKIQHLDIQLGNSILVSQNLQEQRDSVNNALLEQKDIYRELELAYENAIDEKNQYEIMYKHYQREYYQRGDFGVDFELIGTWENENITLMNEELWGLQGGIRIMVNYLEGVPCPKINVPGNPTWNVYTGSKDWHMVLIDMPTDNIPRPGRGMLCVEVSPTPWFRIAVYAIPFD